METTEQQNIDNAITKATQTCLKEELEWLSYIITGDGYTKEYYQKMINERISQIKSRLQEIK